MSFEDTLKNINKFMEKSVIKNLPNMDERETPKLLTSINPAYKTNKTIEELKEIVEQQIVNAEKQEKNNKLLTKLTIFIAIVSLLIQCISMFSPNEEELNLSKKVLELSKDNSQNQVKILKLENELLKAKKTFEKEKKMP